MVTNQTSTITMSVMTPEKIRSNFISLQTSTSRVRCLAGDSCQSETVNAFPTHDWSQTPRKRRLAVSKMEDDATQSILASATNLRSDNARAIHG